VIDVSRRDPAARPAGPRAIRPAGPRAARPHRVLLVRPVSASAFVLRITRESLSFQPGQWINIGLPRRREQREYSVYSAPSDDFLEVLVKEIPGGALSPALRRLAPGDTVEVDGPHGSFTLVEGGREPPRFLFCATGTGVSPFHCMVRCMPGIDYLLLHGVREPTERYDHASFSLERAVTCMSSGSSGSPWFPGRLTEWLRQNPLDVSRYCYLCGNSDMIYETYGILGELGVSRSRIFAEVYF
jgi:ferredoxin--NADP+ reductase/benzoate/toluate 1,2-dioxygenase reductase subunit